MKLVGNIRVSTAAQIEGWSLPGQRERIREWAKQNGHEILSITDDPAVKGHLPADERPGLQTAFDMLRAGEAEGIVFDNFTRFARSLTEQEAMLAYLWDHGWTVYTVDQGEVPKDDPDDPMRTAMRQMAGIWSQLERAETRRRTTRGRALKRAAGGRAEGAAPYGHRTLGKGVLVKEPAEQTVLRRIRRWYENGDSLRAIAAKLNDQAVPPPMPGRRRGRKGDTPGWNHQTIANIAKREGWSRQPAT